MLLTSAGNLIKGKKGVSYHAISPIIATMLCIQRVLYSVNGKHFKSSSGGKSLFHNWKMRASKAAKTHSQIQVTDKQGRRWDLNLEQGQLPPVD